MIPGRRLDDERGLAAAELAVFTGLILLPVLILVASLPVWWERQSLGRLAAQEAARAVVLADDWEQGVATGQTTVDQLAANHGVDPGDVSVSVAGSLDRGEAVTATTTIAVPALAVPYIVTVPTFQLSFAHTETVDAYRSFPP